MARLWCRFWCQWGTRWLSCFHIFSLSVGGLAARARIGVACAPAGHAAMRPSRRCRADVGGLWPAVRAVAALQPRRGALQPAAPVLHIVPALRVRRALTSGRPVRSCRPPRRPKAVVVAGRMKNMVSGAGLVRDRALLAALAAEGDEQGHPSSAACLCPLRRA